MVAFTAGGISRRGPAGLVRLRSSWTRDDAIVTLAAYFERPAGHHVPPPAAAQRTANHLGVPLKRVQEHLDVFAGLDPDNPRTGRPAGKVDRKVWDHYDGDAPNCALDAEWILLQRRRLPKWLQ